MAPITLDFALVKDVLLFTATALGTWNMLTKAYSSRVDELQKKIDECERIRQQYYTENVELMRRFMDLSKGISH